MITIFCLIVFDLFSRLLNMERSYFFTYRDKTETTVLIIDDDAEIRYSLDRVLGGSDGQNCNIIGFRRKGIETAKAEKPTLIFFWIIGWAVFPESKHFSILRTAAPQSLVILMTAYGTTQTAIEAMKHGAFDYVLKPFDLAKLKELVAKALKASRDSGVRKMPTNISLTLLITLKELSEAERRCNRCSNK